VAYEDLMQDIMTGFTDLAYTYYNLHMFRVTLFLQPSEHYDHFHDSAARQAQYLTATNTQMKRMKGCKHEKW
jgi:hypothetical protein